MNPTDEIPNIAVYLERLRSRLMPAERVPKPPAGDKKSAAVLVPLIKCGNRVEVLYTRRSDRLQSHRGQVAFPGGRFDRRDASLLEAALRETHEEVGIEPRAVRVLGSFPGRRTYSTDIAVTPFVGLIEGEPKLTPDPKEVSEIFQVPLAALSDRRYRRTHRWNRNGAAIEHPAIVYGGQVIWGLTYTLTLTFLSLAGQLSI